MAERRSCFIPYFNLVFGGILGGYLSRRIGRKKVTSESPVAMYCKMEILQCGQNNMPIPSSNQYYHRRYNTARVWFLVIIRETITPIIVCAYLSKWSDSLAQIYQFLLQCRKEKKQELPMKCFRPRVMYYDPSGGGGKRGQQIQPY